MSVRLVQSVNDSKAVRGFVDMRAAPMAQPRAVRAGEVSHCTKIAMPSPFVVAIGATRGDWAMVRSQGIGPAMRCASGAAIDLEHGLLLSVRGGCEEFIMPQRALHQGLLDVLIRAGMIAALIAGCYEVFSPFLYLMIWSLILAINLYPLHRMLKNRLGGKDGRAATLIVLIAFILLAVPIYVIGVSMADSAQGAMEWVRSGKFHISPPPDSVASWPLIGPKLFDFWQQAAVDLSSLAQKFAPQLKDVGVTMLGKLAGFGLGLLMFLLALIIAGIIMAFGESGDRSALEICERVFGPDQGGAVKRLVTGTIRAVAQGVIGIAFIQMLLIGTGFVLMGVPGAGLLALLVLILAIAQLPATLITIPVIIYVFAVEGASVATIVFAIYTFVAGLVDNVLKPILLGRGVDVPMPVILIGSLGGMATMGIIGLFIGPVILAVGYQLFWRWVRRAQPADTSATPAAPIAPVGAPTLSAPAAGPGT
jgi:predicted PurR-regulated permease PerM